jgi:hypothetical protein
LLGALVTIFVAAPACAETTVGAQAIVFMGQHYETDNDVRGTAAGGFLEATCRTRRFGLHVEDIPSITARASSASEFGRLAQSISVFTIDGRAYLGRGTHWYLSLGEAIFTQSTPLDLPKPFGDLFTDSRVVGLRVGGGGRLERGATFTEFSFVAAPSMHGNISYRVRREFHVPDLAERASEVDTSAAVGRRVGRFEFLAGLRNINYAADLVRGGSADRNVATGVFLEARYVIGRH